MIQEMQQFTREINELYVKDYYVLVQSIYVHSFPFSSYL